MLILDYILIFKLVIVHFHVLTFWSLTESIMFKEPENTCGPGKLFQMPHQLMLDYRSKACLRNQANETASDLLAIVY